MIRYFDFSRFKKSITHHFLLRTLHLLESCCIYFLSASLLCFLTYILGNFQNFLEATQLTILQWTQNMGIVGMVVGFYYLVFLISWTIRRKKLPLARMGFSLLSLIINLVLAVGSLLIQDLSRGI